MNKTFRRKRLSIDEYAEGILSGDRIILSRAITLVESRLESDNELAEQVIKKILPNTGNCLRLGITGVPGVGKSTFIESFGKYLTGIGKKIAVLTIDPSSQRTQGSILGDKTRMEELANDPNAYVRPSASGNTLGGVNSKTRETMLLCEASGYDVVIIETVGVGQSETTVKGIVDFFLLLMLSGAGDELQGIKRGIMEMADAIAINKADGDNINRSEMAKREYQNALHMFPPTESGWIPRVLTCSAVEKKGMEKIWQLMLKYEEDMRASGFFQRNRQQQNLEWMMQTIQYYLDLSFFNHPEIKSTMPELKKEVTEGLTPAIVAAKELLHRYKK
jgi:LAO/AO transport system kinase